jgi:O-glycosyl hydrolase
MLGGIFIMSLITGFIPAGCASNGGVKAETPGVIEKITAANSAFAAYKFTLPPGAVFGDYTKITAEFLVDTANFTAVARARVLGNYRETDFADIVADGRPIKFIAYDAGGADKNGPYILSNLRGGDTALSAHGAEDANEWFTETFDITGDQKHGSYNSANLPAADAPGPFYFCLGLSIGGENNSITYYARNVTLSNADGSKTVVSSGSDFDAPAFAGYASPERGLLDRTVVTKAGDTVTEGRSRIVVDTGVRHQKITGFGGISNVWGSPDMTVDDIDKMFSPGGLGYNILRVCIYPYMSALFDGTEQYPEGYPDAHKDFFEIAKRAQSYGALILGSPWTPPAEWKSNGSRLSGGYLLPEHYADYAGHLKNFARQMKQNGITLNAVSFQNEPDISVSYDGCDWTSAQMLAFVNQYARTIGGPGTEFPDLKIIPGESFQFRRALTDPILNDRDAVHNVDIIGGHIYGGGLSRYDLAIEKGKEVWMTEHLYNTAGNYNYDSTWDAAWIVAKDIHDCMRADFNAFIWWYLKRFYGMMGDGEYNTVKGEITPRGYVMSHYAKYVTGKTRIDAQVTGPAGVFATAYESDNDISMVVFNSGNYDQDVDIQLPLAVQGASGVKSSESAGNMVDEPVVLHADKKSCAVKLPGKSIMSVTFIK